MIDRLDIVAVRIEQERGVIPGMIRPPARGPVVAAGGRDWRTQPLWGLGLSTTVNGSSAMLHDGRARNVPEAILWHGGEAAVSRDAFRNMPKADRDALVKFVESI